MQHSRNARPLYSVKQFSEKHPAFTQSSLRALIDKARERHSSRGVVPGNGLASAIVRIGRKVLIDEEAFFSWIHTKSREDKLSG
jgi:hypothetical protein